MINFAVPFLTTLNINDERSLGELFLFFTD